MSVKELFEGKSDFPSFLNEQFSTIMQICLILKYCVVTFSYHYTLHDFL